MQSLVAPRRCDCVDLLALITQQCRGPTLLFETDNADCREKSATPQQQQQHTATALPNQGRRLGGWLCWSRSKQDPPRRRRRSTAQRRQKVSVTLSQALLCFAERRNRVIAQGPCEGVRYVRSLMIPRLQLHSTHHPWIQSLSRRPCASTRNLPKQHASAAWRITAAAFGAPLEPGIQCGAPCIRPSIHP